MSRIYLDHAAASPLRPAAKAAMEKALGRGLANPSSLHGEGRASRKLLEGARWTLSEFTGLEAKGFVFTSGATESNRLALEGFARACPDGILGASKADHPSVLGCLEDLARRGHPVKLLPVDEEGILKHDAEFDSDADSDPGNMQPQTSNLKPESPLAVASAASRMPALRSRHSENVGEVGLPSAISILWSNNETGTIQDLEPWFHGEGQFVHVDAVQALGRLADLPGLDRCSALSLSSAKLGGPAGLGALWISPEAPWQSPWTGGKQEGRRRPGTEALALILGLEGALKDLMENMDAERARSQASEKVFLDALGKAKVPFRHNGPLSKGRLPGILNLSFPGWEADQLCAALDLEGVSASPGAACSSGVVRASHVLSAMGRKGVHARSGVRFSWGWDSNVEDARAAAERLSKILSRRQNPRQNASHPPSPRLRRTSA